MIDINVIRENPTRVAEQIAKRGYSVNFDEILEVESTRRSQQTFLEKFRADKNKLVDEVAKLKATKQPVPDKMLEDVKKLNNKIDTIEMEVGMYEKEINEFISALPNIPADDVVAGGKEENRVIKTFGKKPEFNFKPLDHVELCTKLGLIDYERGARMSGAGHWVYTGMGARLEWALLNYFIDTHVANGFTFIMPPHLLNYESGFTAGQFPKFRDDVFQTTIRHEDDTENLASNFRFLLPTAETALINMHRGEILSADKLPIKYAAYSPCYRKEAGSYRQSERGMIRGYQFNKVEMFAFALPNQSEDIFAEFVENAEKLVEGLGLHYQTVALAAGDVSVSMRKTYDIEVFIPSMHGYKEVSSASTAGDYQSRRAQIRTKHADNKKEFVHTLNASGLATSRIIPAIVEQFQTADGHVIIPEPLRMYLGGIERI